MSSLSSLYMHDVFFYSRCAFSLPISTIIIILKPWIIHAIWIYHFYGCWEEFFFCVSSNLMKFLFETCVRNGHVTHPWTAFVIGIWHVSLFFQQSKIQSSHKKRVDYLIPLLTKKILMIDYWLSRVDDVQVDLWRMNLDG